MEVDLPILRSPGRTSVEGGRDLSKSWLKGNTECGTSDLWQARQSRVRKRNFTSLEVSAEMKCESGLTLLWFLTVLAVCVYTLVHLLC